MRQFLIVAALGLAFVSCDNQQSTSTTKEVNNSLLKTAYVDTSRLMTEYEESKDFEKKYSAMSERMKNELESDMKKFQRDVEDLQRNAQSKGMQWAQQREAELTRRQQTLMQKEQNYMVKFQEEGAIERDSLVNKVKTFIQNYGEENGYDYIYGTGDAATILYAKEEFDITDEIIRLLNESYGKKDEATEEIPANETEEQE